MRNPSVAGTGIAVHDFETGVTPAAGRRPADHALGMARKTAILGKREETRRKYP
jgi:hypothetical protein